MGMSSETLPYQEKLLSKDEEDRLMRIVDAGIAAEPEIGIEVPAHQPGPWFTAYDTRISKEEWNRVIEGTLLVYLIGELKYSVLSGARVTESCMILTRDFPALHTCIDHNRTFSLHPR